MKYQSKTMKKTWIRSHQKIRIRRHEYWWIWYSFICKNDIEEISLPSNLKIIGSYSFSKSHIKEIFIPPTVTKINNNAFYLCENLVKVEIP